MWQVVGRNPIQWDRHTPCVYISDVKVGDLREKSLSDIWDCELFAVLSDRSRRGDHCVVRDFRSCCGGCRARSYAYTGDITAGDPGCIITSTSGTSWVCKPRIGRMSRG
jgi:radical SAM protein with 4Fe4S-binding SPASM domain